MNFKVGDIIHHRSLGLMLLTEKYVETPVDPNNERHVKFRESRRNFHGYPLFYMEKLNSTDGNNWILYDKSIEKYEVRLATNEDIIETLVYDLHSYMLNDNLKLNIDPKEKSMSLYSINEYEDFFIILDKKAIKTLKKQLQELNV